MSQQDEIGLFWNQTVSAVEAIIASLGEAPEEAWNWKPVEEASSLYALAAHVIGSTEEHILEGICGQPVGRNRDAEFAPIGAATLPIHAKWQDVQARIEAALDALPNGALDAKCDDPRLGEMTAREILLITAQHCGEHRGHAELTLQLLMAQSSGD